MAVYERWIEGQIVESQEELPVEELLLGLIRALVEEQKV